MEFEDEIVHVIVTWLAKESILTLQLGIRRISTNLYTYDTKRYNYRHYIALMQIKRYRKQYTVQMNRHNLPEAKITNLRICSDYDETKIFLKLMLLRFRKQQLFYVR